MTVSFMLKSRLIAGALGVDADNMGEVINNFPMPESSVVDLEDLPIIW